mmetsp:Transcript_16613/g.28303  ORF Transcript_16613/g.28303 Transcript_16613/m.28303 type:complete len:187 (-) Transcript_16613:59-619(-)
MRKRGVIVIGFIQISVAMAMIGGSDSLFQFHKQPIFIFVGLCVIGLSAGMISIPVLPEMLQAVEDDNDIAQKYSMETIENLISGLFVSFQSIGEAIGPVLSSYIAELYGFKVTQEFFSGLLFIFWFSYFLVCGGCYIFEKDSPSEVTKLRNDSIISLTPKKGLDENSNNYRSRRSLSRPASKKGFT